MISVQYISRFGIRGELPVQFASSSPAWYNQHRAMTGRNFEAAYLRAYRDGLFPQRIEKAWAILESCTLCPRACRVNRLKGELGICRAGSRPDVSSYSPH